jgi:hypothetical protein
MKATHQPTTEAVDLAMTPAELLRGAAHYLQQHGWTQHQFYDLLADTSGPFLPACASGAIVTAACGSNANNSFFTVVDDDAQITAALRAMRFFADWIDGGYIPVEGYPASSIDVIGDWNDYDGRTIDEVIETLTDAADDWETTNHTGGAR